MNSKIPRRDFIKSAPVAALALSEVVQGVAKASPAPGPTKLKIEAFDYQGVTFGESRWQRQFQACRDYYYNVSDDDILHGYRARAGLPAPGKALGGWCSPNSNTVFGQWMMGMSRISRAVNDTEMRNKVVNLYTEWAKTVPANGNANMGHYPFEKMVGGLVDIQMYAGHTEAAGTLEKVVDYAIGSFDRTRTAAGPRPWANHSGHPGEWYTVGENLYRAYQLSGNEKYKDFADVWLYHDYWNKFADTANPPDAWGVHAYSHLNSFNSAAMAYSVTGDEKYLNIIRNAYDFMQNTQCYATGGVGPSERILPTNGNLGKALDYHQNSCETPCCSWASYRLARYLTQYTGEARYGDWIERLLYNGVGGILPIRDNGKHFYYADYRVAGGVKIYAREAYTCCSGTYIQGVTDFINQIYYKDPSSLYVSLYLPSEVTWNRAGGDVKVTQQTRYPEAETSTFKVDVKQSAPFALKFRVPGWSKDMSIKLNGQDSGAKCEPGQWAVLDRTWNAGDTVEIHIPLKLRFQAVDQWHPHRIAVVRGPVVMVQEGNAHEPVFKLPDTDAELNEWLKPDRQPGWFTMNPPDGQNVIAKFLPFYAAIESLAYRMYFDNDKLPFILWAGTWPSP